MEETNSKSSVPFWRLIRIAVTFLGFLGMIAHFSQRVNVGIALVCMVNHSAIEQNKLNSTTTTTLIIHTDDSCSQTNNTNHIEGPFIWTKNMQGIILGAYFWGYIITQIPAGYLASRFGPRFLFGGAIILSSVITAFMPIIASVHWILFCILRLLIGLAHGTISPCMAVIMAHWAPVHERGKLMGFMNAGGPAGNAFGLLIGGLICSWHIAGGWPFIFYSAAVFGFIWGITWILFYTNSPRNHRFISIQEKEYILQNTQQQLSNSNKNDFHPPWRAIFTSPACWALFIIHTCNNWGTYTFLTSAPKYMDEVLKFNIKSNGFLSALPYIMVWLSTNISGIIADIIIRKNLLTTTNTRKLFNILGNLLPAICVLSLAFLTCQLKYVAVILLTISFAFRGCCIGGGYLLVANDIAPAYAGIVFGISNTLATIPGIVSPYVVGTLTEKDPNNWRIVFFICAAIYIIGMIVFTFLGSGELQPWARTSIEARISFENPLSRENDQSVQINNGP
ncbi:unnamed protein product [Rotaria sordida]|uniref:Major facilitator superfamily (MFS) profile domain-containing protein n=1 Tax=Rotaria sordida TaxID=392033 RepID=A0A815EIG9_9BILA|nr:unnamed protein product [Rotaria sordida]CAF1440440.1 unnamed protein product [Rotaria sordida]CAF3750847.1 unnamed protein product [Rotaria sordida]CAF3941579.1 unnamed protein product [Rotaria sordida]